jgi:hypothetical protein
MAGIMAKGIIRRESNLDNQKEKTTTRSPREMT